jgi:membrane protease YdiL (CAAX protease family)
MTTTLPDPGMPSRHGPVWGYEDLVLFVGAVLPSLALGALLARIARVIAPRMFAGSAATNLSFQLFMYAFLTGALYLIVSFRHGEPFWRSLGWTLRFRGAVLSVAAGPLLAVAASLLGAVLRTPAAPNPIQEMIRDRGSLAIVVSFGVLAAPFFEELFFRGFLFPLLARSWGHWLGIVATAIPFGLLHGAQNHWIWQQITLITLAGVVFGYVRYKTGSTAAAFLIHASFNATEFFGFLLTRL